MALTADTSYVTGIDPVYNPINFILGSNNSANLNYKYVFNLYSGTTSTGPLLSTIKLNPRPNGSCQYNPARILESIVSQDVIVGSTTVSGRTVEAFTNKILVPTKGINVIKSYDIEFLESFTGIRFTNNTSINGKVGLLISGYNPFLVGDSVTISQDTGYVYSSYNGNQSVISASTTGITINVNYSASTGTTGGYITYASGDTTFTLSGTSYSGKTFNSVLQYDQYPTWSPIPYTVYNSTGTTLNRLFLTYAPRNNVNVKNSTDSGTLSILVDDALNSVPVKIVTKIYYNPVRFTDNRFTPTLGFDIPTGTNPLVVGDIINVVQDIPFTFSAYNGTHLVTAIIPTGIRTPDPFLGSTPAEGGWIYYSRSGTTNTVLTNGIYHIPSGIWNISQLSGSTGLTPNATSYSVQVLQQNNTPLSEEFFFNIDRRCSKYQTVRLQFLNSLGGWDYMNFDMVSRKIVNINKRDFFKKNLPVGYNVGDREKTQLDIDGSFVYNVTSNWMNTVQSAWVQELFISKDVRIINPDQTSWPVNILLNTLDIQKSINQRMISYTFDLESAYSINGQRA